MWPEIVKVVSEGGAGVPPSEIEPWVALARRFVRREGGSVHVTDPALGLMAHYGFDPGLAIYTHFGAAGVGGHTTTYVAVSKSSPGEQIGASYAPERDHIVIWRRGELEGEEDFR